MQDGIHNINIVLSFLHLYHNWNPNQLVCLAENRPSLLFDEDGVPDFVIDCPTWEPQMLLQQPDDSDQIDMKNGCIKRMRELLQASIQSRQFRPFGTNEFNQQRYQQLAELCSKKPREPEEKIEEQVTRI